MSSGCWFSPSSTEGPSVGVTISGSWRFSQRLAFFQATVSGLRAPRGFPNFRGIGRGSAVAADEGARLGSRCECCQGASLKALRAGVHFGRGFTTAAPLPCRGGMN